jgi:hypothetical protein
MWDLISLEMLFLEDSMIRKGSALGLLVFLILATTIFGEVIELKKVYTYKFSQDTERTPLKGPIDFAVTEEEIFLIPSFNEGRIAAYELNGGVLTLASSIGEFGDGPNGLIEPAFIDYSKRENRLLIWDHKLRKTFIYIREPRGFSFTREKEIHCLYGATSMILDRDRLFLAGYIMDKESQKEYEYYSYDLLNKTSNNEYEINYYLKSKKKYFEVGKIPEQKEYRDKFLEEIVPLGTEGYFDISYEGDKLYTVWQYDNRINVIDLSTGKLVEKIRGGKTYYKKPKATPEIKKAYNMRNWATHRKELGKFSKIKNLYLTRDYILLIFENKTTQENLSIYYLEFIKFDDKKNSQIISFLGKPDQMFYFDEDVSALYTLIGDWDKDDKFLYIKETSKYIIK